MMKVNTPLRIGAIGCGSMATGFHLPGIQRIPELKLVALCDINQERLKAASARFNIADTFTDFDAEDAVGV